MTSEIKYFDCDSIDMMKDLCNLAIKNINDIYVIFIKNTCPLYIDNYVTIPKNVRLELYNYK